MKMPAMTEAATPTSIATGTAARENFGTQKSKGSEAKQAQYNIMVSVKRVV